MESVSQNDCIFKSILLRVKRIACGYGTSRYENGQKVGSSTSDPIHTDLSRVFTSEPFTFIVGSEKERVVVHSKAIARLSPSLKVLISGPMQEAQTKIVEWDDVEPEDFIKFCQFAYIGDYSPPELGVEMEKRPSEEKTALPPTVQELANDVSLSWCESLCLNCID